MNEDDEVVDTDPDDGGVEEPQHRHRWHPLYHYTKAFQGPWRRYYCICGQQFDFPVVDPPTPSWEKILHGR